MELKNFNFASTAAAADYAAGIVAKCVGIAAAGFDMVTAKPMVPAPARAFKFA